MASRFFADLMTRIALPFLDEPGDGGGGGAAGSQGTGSDGVGKPAGDGSQGDSGGTSKPGAAPAKAAEDDRTKGILADLQKECKSRQQFETQVRDLNAKLEAETRRVQALAGVNPKSKDEEDQEAVRQRFKALYPHLADLTPEDIKAMRELRTQSANLQETTTHHWALHGRKMMDSVVDGITKEIGGTLTERQITRIKQAYVLEAENNPEFLTRHNAGDPAVVTEFVKNYIEDFFEPARRRVTQIESDRLRRVPSGRDRSLATSGGKKVDVNNPKAFEDALVESFQKHGGAFGE